jgi:hypothetical protein
MAKMKRRKVSKAKAKMAAKKAWKTRRKRYGKNGIRG